MIHPVAHKYEMLAFAARILCEEIHASVHHDEDAKRLQLDPKDRRTFVKSIVSAMRSLSNFEGKMRREYGYDPS